MQGSIYFLKQKSTVFTKNLFLPENLCSARISFALSHSHLDSKRTMQNIVTKFKKVTPFWNDF